MTGASVSSPESELAALPAENGRLRRFLDLTPAQARLPAATQTGLFLDGPGPVTGDRRLPLLAADFDGPSVMLDALAHLQAAVRDHRDVAR